MSGAPDHYSHAVSRVRARGEAAWLSQVRTKRDTSLKAKALGVNLLEAVQPEANGG
jgi:hypothetical protein